MDCSVHQFVRDYAAIGWLCRFANQGHDLESRLGIPNGIAYFGAADSTHELAVLLAVLRVFSAACLILVLFTMGIFVPACDLLRPSTRRNWIRRNTRQLSCFLILYWVGMVGVSTSLPFLITRLAMPTF